MKAFSFLVAIILTVCQIHAQSGSKDLSICMYEEFARKGQTEPEQSIKGLRRLAKEGTNEQIIDYAVGLYGILKKTNTEAIENSKVQKMISEIINDYILPAAKKGDLRCITILAIDQNMGSYWCLDKLQISADPSSVRHYMIFQSYVGTRVLNSESWGNDQLLYNYFKLLPPENTFLLRDTLEKRIREFNDSYGLKGASDIILPFFCQKMDKDGVYSFTGQKLKPEPIQFLKYLLDVISIMYQNSDAKALAHCLISMREYKMRNINYEYSDPKSQWFKSDEQYGPIIFKILSSFHDHTDASPKIIAQKSYYLNEAGKLGDGHAYYNLACLFQYHYQYTENSNYNDSCIKYIEKAIRLNYPGAFTLKGFKTFNGDGYKVNKQEGVNLIKKAMYLGDVTATKLLVEYPKTIFSGKREGYYFRESIKIREPWDLLLRCSNDCGKYTYPKTIFFNYKYDGSDNPQIKGIVNNYLDKYKNPAISFTEDDFQKTMGIAYMGFEYWKHLMCSESCQQSHSKKNDEYWETAKKRREAFNNEVIQCSACQKSFERGRMTSISECPCEKPNGETLNIGFGAALDIYGSTEPKVCSSVCFLNFCEKKCNEKGLIKK